MYQWWRSKTLHFQWNQVLLLPKCDNQRTHHKKVQNLSPIVRPECWLVESWHFSYQIQHQRRLFIHINFVIYWSVCLEKLHSVCAIFSYHASQAIKHLVSKKYFHLLSHCSQTCDPPLDSGFDLQTGAEELTKRGRSEESALWLKVGKAQKQSHKWRQ